jgi:uncharacterized lipoprotein YddW (UPF0748 family)
MSMPMTVTHRNMMKRPVIALLLLLTITTVLFPQRLKEFRAVKITNVDSNVLFTDQNIADAMDYLASIGVNVILPVVWNAAYTQYPSAVMDSIFKVPIHPQFAGRDPLQRLVIEAHRVGIEVYPWFEYGFAAWYSGSGAPTGGHILQKFPQWASRTSDGQICKKNGFDWMSPINPEVQSFINALVKEVITKYDVDGVEFSDRIPAMPVEGGYDSVTVALYKSEHGGSAPPVNFSDASWMRWRADKMNLWYADVRAIIKSRSPKLFVSSSPSIYPWSYQEYLQDVKTWIDTGVADHFIPQLYRYSFSEYSFELQNAITQSGANKKKLFPGILMNIGTGANEYVISADYLMKAVSENRKNGVNGEAFFYYEGLRKNNNRLGDTLKATFYKEPALVPERGESAWRFPAAVMNETDPSTVVTGPWSTYLMKGFSGAIIRTNDSLPGAKVQYRCTVPVTAYYDLFAYRVPNSPWTKQARFTLHASADSQIVTVDQSDLTKKGWQKLGNIHVTAGERTIVTLDNSLNEPGRYTVADAVMMMINRTLSPDAVLDVQQEYPAATVAVQLELLQNYPNPFNPTTTIQYTVPSGSVGRTMVEIYDVIGRKAAVLVDDVRPAGTYSVPWDASAVAGGLYIVRLNTGSTVISRKIMLVK